MPRKSDFDWEAHSEILRVRYERGDATKEIASDFGVTKNQVISRAKTMKLRHPTKLRENMFKREKEREQRKKLGLTEERLPKPPPKKYVEKDNVVQMSNPHIEMKTRHWTTRTNSECSWPIGEGADMHYCCRPLDEGQKAYCGEHAKIAYTPSRAKTPSTTPSPIRNRR